MTIFKPKLKTLKRPRTCIRQEDLACPSTSGSSSSLAQNIIAPFGTPLHPLINPNQSLPLTEPQPQRIFKQSTSPVSYPRSSPPTASHIDMPQLQKRLRRLEAREYQQGMHNNRLRRPQSVVNVSRLSDPFSKGDIFNGRAKSFPLLRSAEAVYTSKARSNGNSMGSSHITMDIIEPECDLIRAQRAREEAMRLYYKAGKTLRRAQEREEAIIFEREMRSLRGEDHIPTSEHRSNNSEHQSVDSIRHIPPAFEGMLLFSQQNEESYQLSHPHCHQGDNMKYNPTVLHSRSPKMVTAHTHVFESLPITSQSVNTTLGDKGTILKSPEAFSNKPGRVLASTYHQLYPVSTNTAVKSEGHESLSTTMNTTSVGDDEYCQDKTRFRLFKGLRVATAAPRQGCPDIRAFKHADTKNRVVESPLFRQSSTPLSQIPIKYHAEDQVKIPPSPSPQPQWRRAPSTGVSIGQSPLEPSLSQRSQQEEAGSFPTQYPIRQQTPSQANPQHQTNDQPGRQISSTVFADVLNVLTQREEHNQPCPFVVYCTYIERVEHLHHGVQGCCCTSQRPQSHCGAANESNT